MDTTLFFKRPFRVVQPHEMTAPRQPQMSPSLRLRVTAANRSLLRWLRAAELAAWEEPTESERRAFRFFNR
jgi:hypothetical protein